MMLITHDLGVVAQTCHRACVMYCGKLIEQSATGPLFAAPAHPYTAGLLASVPRIRTQRLDSLPTIAGTVPDLLHLPRGCRFVERCGQAIDLCHSAHPPLQVDEHSGHELACYNPVQGEAR